MAKTPRETESPGQPWWQVSMMQPAVSRCIVSFKTIKKIHHILELEFVFWLWIWTLGFTIHKFHFTFSVLFSCFTSEAMSHLPIINTCILFTCIQQQYLGHRFTCTHWQIILCRVYNFPMVFPCLLTQYGPSLSLSCLCCLSPTRSLCLSSFWFLHSIKTCWL